MAAHPHPRVAPRRRQPSARLAGSVHDTTAGTYRSLLARLPELERADLSGGQLAAIAARLTDPAEVARSRVLPPAIWNVRHHTGSMLFEPELDRALTLSMANVAARSDRALLLVDISGSMGDPLVGHTGLRAFEVATMLAIALDDASHRGGGSVDVVAYASASQRLVLGHHAARAVADVAGRIGALGHCRDPWGHVEQWYDAHDAVHVFTDAPHDPRHAPDEVTRWDVPVTTWDLRGTAPPAVGRDPRLTLVSGHHDAALARLNWCPGPAGEHRAAAAIDGKCARLRA